MGAGASAASTPAVFDQLMQKWDELAQQPQYANDVAKPANYDELLKMGVPASGAEREFFIAMRNHFRDVIKEESKIVIEIPLSENQSTSAGSLQDAFKNRPQTSKKRPNKKRQALKQQAIKANAAPYLS